ncbi:hypothetical protein [Streptomyces sviceus]|uniref:hypothetical protein n=1 Tax=Streptomyces sviceus TaxID=285530 RepID=UPI00367A2D6A
MSLTGGNHNEVPQLLPPLDKIPAFAGVVGWPRWRPDMLFTDCGYDHAKCRRLLHGLRRLRIRWDRRDDIHEAFLGIAAPWNCPTRQ